MKKSLFGISLGILFFFIFSNSQAQEIDSECDNNYNSVASSSYSPNPLIDSMLTFAFKYLGKPYSGGSKGPNSFDCSGFTGFVYNHFGYKLGASSGDQTKDGVQIPVEDLQPGDLVFWKGRNANASRVGHVGMVVKVNPDKSFTFIHAACRTGVSHDHSDAPYYTRRYVTACRVINSDKITPHIPEKTEPIEEILSGNVVSKEQAPSKTPKQRASTPAEVKMISIVVEKGQTLFSLSKKYGCTIEEIKGWNDLSGNSLFFGQKLIIGTKISEDIPEQTVLQEKSEEVTNSPKPRTHVVQKGESLYSIAQAYDCTVNDIQNWNNLVSAHIEPGQELTMGNKHTKLQNNSTLYHKVKSGETLSNIAEKYNCTIKALKQINGLHSNKITINQRIKIP